MENIWEHPYLGMGHILGTDRTLRAAGVWYVLMHQGAFPDFPTLSTHSSSVFMCLNYFKLHFGSWMCNDVEWYIYIYYTAIVVSPNHPPDMGKHNKTMPDPRASRRCLSGCCRCLSLWISLCITSSTCRSKQYFAWWGLKEVVGWCWLLHKVQMPVYLAETIRLASIEDSW